MRSKKFAFNHFVKEVLKATRQDTMNLHSAALSFFSIFTFIPLLITTYLIYSNISEDIANDFLITAATSLGSEQANILIRITESLHDIPPFAYVVGSIVVIYAMTRFMYFMQKSMNKIWRTKPHMEEFKIEVQHRIISVLSILGLLILTTFIALQRTTIKYLHLIFGGFFSKIIFYLLILLILFMLFSFLYKFVPDRPITWRDVRYGAIFSTLMFWIGYAVLGEIMQISWIDNIYATISYAFLALLWIYIFAQIFYIGATISKVYALHYGSLQKHRDEFHD